MNLYTAEGWPDMRVLDQIPAPFLYCWGGRGCGKTYSYLKYVTIESPRKFLYIRRTQRQVDILATPSKNPFKKINADLGETIMPMPEKDGSYLFYRTDTDADGRVIRVGEPLGYMVALSTFANMRGFDGSEVVNACFDEFIPQDGERELKHEYFILMNLYETINRNREFTGDPPLQLWCFANANTPTGNIMLSGEILGKAIEMQKQKKNYSLMQSRGIALLNMFDSPISQKKEDTALYRATRGTAFYDMAINNKFELDDSIPLKNLPLREFKPVCAIGELGIWQHKNEQYIYISKKQDPSVRKFVIADYDVKVFKKQYAWLYLCYLQESVVFESEVCALLFVEYFEMT